MTSTPIAIKILFLLMLSDVFLPGASAGHQEDLSHNIGIVEKTGDRIPLDLAFHDETGATMKLGDFVGKPTILIPVYFGCDHYCPQTLGGLAAALNDLNLSPGKDYQLITISFDEDDDPAIASHVKANYTKAAGDNFPDGAWKFLTGSRESIGAITEAIGFHFMRHSHGFIHPVVLVFVSPQGMITGYHYVSAFRYGVESSVSFSSAELAAGMANASKGMTGLGVRKNILYCFPHQPAGQERFFRMLEVTGAVTIFSLIFFFIYLKATGRRSSQGSSKGNGRD